MKIDEFIEQLQKIRSSKGNIDVNISIYNEVIDEESITEDFTIEAYDEDETEMVSAYVNICCTTDSFLHISSSR